MSTLEDKIDVDSLYTTITLHSGLIKAGEVIVRASQCHTNWRVIQWMEVDSTYRRQGIAKILLKRIVQMFHGYTIIAALEHEYLHAMYLAEGFVREKDYTWELEDGRRITGVWFYHYPTSIPQ